MQLLLREYLRVSKDRDGAGRSPDQQHAENAAAVEQRGWDLHPEPYRDDDRSASRYARRAREGFETLMADLERNAFGAQGLALWESSRGSRRAGEWVDLIDLCEERGVRIWVTTHGRLYDPANARDRRSLLEDAVDSEYESAKTSERLRRSVRANAEKGRPHGKQIYGYQRVYDPTTRALIKVEPHPDQAPVVQEAARRVLSGETFYAIAKDLNERGIPARRPTYRTQRAHLGWTPPAIKQMLSMPAYAAKRQHRGEVIGDAGWPWLIEPDTWEKLQSVMSPPERKRTNDWPARHLLAGIAVCGVCGAGTRVGKQNAGRQKHDDDGKKLPRDTYHTYVCVGAPGKTGFHIAMRESHLDRAVTEAALARLDRADFLATLGQNDQGVDAERQALIDEIAGHREWLDQVRVRAEEERDLDLLFGQQRIVEPKIKDAQRRLERLAETDPLVLDLARSGAVREAWEGLEIAQRRRVIRALVTPRIMPVPPSQRGRRGINLERIDLVWC